MAGLRGLQAHKARAVASRYMWEFFRQSGCTVTMTACLDMRSVVVERFRSIQDQNDTPFVGHSYPLHAGASHRIPSSAEVRSCTKPSSMPQFRI